MRALAWSLVTGLLFAASPAAAQGDAAGAVLDPTVNPAAVKVAKITDGYRLTDRNGLTLYTLDPKEALRRGRSPYSYCIDECAERFAPLEAAPDAVAIGMWKPQKTKLGLQWAYNNSPVFTYRADRGPDDTGGQGYEDIFRTMPYVPPQPSVIAPAPVVARYVKGKWLLAYGDGALLVTQGKGKDSGVLEPFHAGVAARSIGDWSVLADGDAAQWAYRRKPVFLAAAGGSALPKTVEPIEVKSK